MTDTFDSPTVIALAARLGQQVGLDVAELGDRSSPEDQPDMMLVTAKELSGIIEFHAQDVLREATAEIERLRSENAQMRAALEPFAKVESEAERDEAPFAKRTGETTSDSLTIYRYSKTAAITVGDLRRARAAIAIKERG